MQVDVLRAMAKVNPNIVGVISAGSAIEMEWEDSLKAILHGYLTGQAGAGAMLDLLTGRVNPSGKLAETYPMVYEDTPSQPCYPAKERNSDYREALFVGYRYFDTFGKEVRYPFGYGLSYTTFEYSDLKVDEKGVTFTVKNTGASAGAEVAQLYVCGSRAALCRSSGRQNPAGPQGTQRICKGIPGSRRGQNSDNSV